MLNKKEVIKTGKSWKNDSFYETFEEADAKRNQIVSIWENNEEHKGMQVKVKHLSSRNKFVVKTRLHPDFEPVKKEKKKNVKRNKKNKRDNGSRKFDAARIN